MTPPRCCSLQLPRNLKAGDLFAQVANLFPEADLVAVKLAVLHGQLAAFLVQVLKAFLKVLAVPALEANHVDAELFHEAAIGKIAGEQLDKLMTLGLTAEEAEEQIINGFLK